MASGTKEKKAAPVSKPKTIVIKAAASPRPGRPGAKPDGVAPAPSRPRPVPRAILTMVRPLAMLADPTRLRVLAYLYDGKASNDTRPGEIATVVGIDPEAARAALASLKAIGWVASTGEGPGRVVRATDEGLRAYEWVSRAFGSRDGA